MRDLDLLTIPVIGFDRDDGFYQAFNNIDNLRKTGICIRLVEEDIVSPRETNDAIGQLINDFHIDKHKIDIIIDHRSLVNRELNIIRLNTIELLNELLKSGNFRTLTLASSNFPRDMSNIRKDSFSYVARYEYELWKEISKLYEDRGIYIHYADYSTVHPDFVDLQNVSNANAKIRYTAKNEWAIHRGHNLREEPKYEQYRDLSNNVINSSEYMGKDFSWGDDWIYNCANDISTTGNLTTWVAVDTNHHIEFTSAQILNDVQMQGYDALISEEEF